MIFHEHKKKKWENGYGIEKLSFGSNFDKSPVAPFMRKSVTYGWLLKNPKYAELFHECPECHKNSFCNRDIYARITSKRKCRECGHIEE